MFVNKEHQLAYEALQENNYSLAIELYTECLSENSSQAVLYSERAVAYIHLNEKDKSLADFNTSVVLEPNYAYRYASRGHAKDFFGDIDGAILDYEKAVELDPKDAINYNNLGLLLEKKGNLDKAKELFERSDKLRKAEDQLHDLMDSMEGKANEANIETSAVNTEPKKETVWTIFGSLFTEKTARQEFKQFLFNRFKLKKND